MSRFHDFLVYYNNLDVGPFVKAVTNFQEFYGKNDLDVFKIAISAPGITRKMLFDSAKEKGINFPLFSQADYDLYKTVKQNIVGGPSIIFKRHHKTNETFIRNNADKICKNILGYDTNALYLWALSQELPTTAYSTILGDGNYLISDSNNVKINHKLNYNGKEKCDWYDPKNNMIYEFHGCYFHGHNPANCSITRKISCEKWLKKQPILLEKTRILGSTGMGWMKYGSANIRIDIKLKL